MPKNPRPSLADAQRAKQQSYSPQAAAARAAATAPKMPADEPTTRLNVNLPQSLYERFRHAAQADGRSMTWIVTQFVQQYTTAFEQMGKDE